MGDLSKENKSRLRQFRAEAQMKLDLQRKEQEHADATLGDIREELGALAFAAGISLVELHTLLSQYGDRGVEALQYLICGQADTVEEALKKVWEVAGKEAGKIIDPISVAFGRRSHGGTDLISEMIRDEEAARPHRGRHKTTKADLAASAQWERDQIADLRIFFEETIAAHTDDGG